MSRVAALVLAAGFSRRFGTDKRRASLLSGESLLQASLARARGVFEESWVVLRGDDPASLAHGCEPVFCSASTLGMGHSLAAGVQAIQQASNAEAIALLLGDMPWISTDSLQTLARLAQQDRILLPCHRQQRGHPVVFGRDFWPALLNCRGDVGARDVLLQHASACHRVELDDPGILRDVDQPADLIAS